MAPSGSRIQLEEERNLSEVPRDRELDFCGVYRVDSVGALELIADDFELPNGLCFSPDESFLYVNDTICSHIRRFGVQRGRVMREEFSAKCRMPPTQSRVSPTV